MTNRKRDATVARATGVELKKVNNILFMPRAVLLKVKPSQYNIWKEWCTELSGALYSEAKKTLIEEKIIQELTIGFEIEGECYVIGYMDGECLPANMSRTINQKHKAMKEQCLEMVGEIEVLANIKCDSC